ncbi:phosphoserine phosphatase SerB [Paralimibaculum aggregatum]|uniref:Phosphoserine phosphatase n=1 Tax=Paralimibaculum aggregatum TaxID=3036245 RepID=A0ABQ6LND8_9RHOB|nr:phosphoserine phosphatase SerB [Limibaculum sp. NKW23]GMG81775.1 phosphoserine phosphatase SerB [Limibaculum sp. NKW23]
MVLTAAPGRGLSDADVAAAALALDEAGEPRRLGPWAAEIPCPRPAAPRAPSGVDANWVPAEAREKRILIADMDSTMIGVECIDEIADMAGIKEQVAAITERAMAGELDFEAALAERVALLEGLPETALADAYAARVALNPGARLLVRTMAARGAHVALVSGGFTYFTERVAAAAGFAEHRANVLEIVAGRLTGRVIPPVLGRAAKAEALDEFCARCGASPAEVLALGDGANDLAMIEAAGLGVGYRPKPALAEKADAVLRHSDLSAVLHLQGIPEAAWTQD